MNSNRPSILIVSDSLYFDNQILDLLAKKFEIIIIHEAFSFLDSCTAAQPDIILIDYKNDSKIDIGLLLYLLKCNDAILQIPIVVISEVEDVVLINRFLESGIFDIIKLPIDNFQLTLRLENIIQFHRKLRKKYLAK